MGTFPLVCHVSEKALSLSLSLSLLSFLLFMSVAAPVSRGDPAAAVLCLSAPCAHFRLVCPDCTFSVWEVIIEVASDGKSTILHNTGTVIQTERLQNYCACVVLSCSLPVAWCLDSLAPETE